MELKPWHIGREVLLQRKAAVRSGCDDYNDILSMMLKFEVENPDYTIEEQIDDFLTFIVAGDH